VSFTLDGYVDVPTRLRRALETFPDLRVQEGLCRIVETPAGHVMECHVTVWRTEQDTRPTTASASEPYPGKTPYTRDSERMVGMTSALGRALGYMGFGIENGIASANEIAARRTDGEPSNLRSERRTSTASLSAPSDGQLRLLRALGSTQTPATKQEAMKLIDELKAKQTEGEVFG
jgi:hypothetical protein